MLCFQEKFQDKEVDIAEKEEFAQKMLKKFSIEMSAFYISSRVLDDGIILPHDTRKVRIMYYPYCRRKVRHPMNFPNSCTDAFNTLPHNTAF